MTNADVGRYPRTILGEAGELELRSMTTADEPAVLAFARALPDHDLLFLPRDIAQPKVLAAWIAEIERGALTTVLAAHNGTLVGCATLAREELSWSAHVGEIRVVVAAQMRSKGIGRLLIEEIFRIALRLGLEKLIAQMTVDQRGAIAVFESMGFRGEALLRDHVKDRGGAKHDLVILSHDVARFQSQMDAYGMTEAL
jgi:RimJ/RimL family protein N-acetyltransferase